MKYNIKTKLSAFLSIMMLMMPITSYGMATSSDIEKVNGDSLIIERTFMTADENDIGRHLFDNYYEKDGKTYELDDIRTEILSTENVEGDTYILTSERKNTEEELTEPEKEIEHNGVKYTLKSSEIKTYENDQYSKHVEREVIYKGIENGDQIPKLAEIVSEDKNGTEVSKYMPLIKVTVEKENWDSTFEFPIKITNYDSDIFMLNGTEIKKGDPLINYEKEFLDYLGLDIDYYIVKSIDWDGEEYVSNGVVYRNAIAKGDKIVKDVTALYGGEMVFGESTTYAYESVYMSTEKPDSTVYKMKATGIYKEVPKATSSNAEEEPNTLIPEVPDKNIFERVIDWVLENPIAAISIGTLLIIGIVIIILFLLSKKKKEEEQKGYEVIDFDKKDKE